MQIISFNLITKLLISNDPNYSHAFSCSHTTTVINDLYLRSTFFFTLVDLSECLYTTFHSLFTPSHPHTRSTQLFAWLFATLLLSHVFHSHSHAASKTVRRDLGLTVHSICARKSDTSCSKLDASAEVPNLELPHRPEFRNLRWQRAA